VPGLAVFATLLGEEAELSPGVRFYQRLVALDDDGAAAVVDEALKARPRAEVFDTVLVPALSRAERDAAEGHLDEVDLAFIRRVVGEIIEDLEGTPEITLATVSQTAPTPAAAPVPDDAPATANATARQVIAGVAGGPSDELALRMLAQLLASSGLDLELITDAATPLALSERLGEIAPATVVLSHLPPGGLTPARYQVRRLRARLPGLPLVVGRWGGAGAISGEAAARLAEAGASHVTHGLADARDYLVSKFAPSPAPVGAERDLIGAGT
jgi:hypothetical protein